MWIIFIDKENKEIVEYLKINDSYHIVFNNERVIFYHKDGMSYFDYDKYYIDDSFCDGIPVAEGSGEEKFYVEILSKLLSKFKEVKLEV